MSNPTSSFGWQMPTSSDLVTDLPADFEVFGQAVDTTLADLKGGTTGQILSKASGTDMDFTWVAPTTGDITGVSVTSPITGGGTSGDVTIGISSSAVVPSQTGNSGKYLTTDGTTSSWGTVATGGMTLISTTTLSGTTTTISSIPSTYVSLYIVFENMTSGTANTAMRYQFNSDTGSNYTYRSGSGSGTITKTAYFGWDFGAYPYAGSSPYNGSMTIQNYTATTNAKPVQSQFVVQGDVSPGYSNQLVQGAYYGTSAISSMTVYTFASGTIGGTVKIYGVK
jgi:hypothetical protein